MSKEIKVNKPVAKSAGEILYEYKKAGEEYPMTVNISDIDSFVSNFNTDVAISSVSISTNVHDNISDIRRVLFETIQKVRNGEIEADSAKAIANLSQVVLNSAKLELEIIKETKNGGLK